MIRHHHDPDLGTTHVHVTDHGDVELHRDSAAGHSTFDLGQICAVQLALDILRISGQADAAIVQSIANTIEARAEAGDVLSTSEMRSIAMTLRCGVGAPVVLDPVRVGNVVRFPLVVTVRVEGMVA